MKQNNSIDLTLRETADLIIFYSFLKLASEVSLVKGIEPEAVACKQLINSILTSASIGYSKLREECLLLAPCFEGLLPDKEITTKSEEIN